ncbi:MAG: AsmA-like C-terminal region-containing protein [Bryobacteraceae bacterium]
MRTVTVSRRFRIFILIAIVAVVVLAALAAIVALRFQPVARDYVLTVLRNRYRSKVELGNLQISLFPTVRATGENLVLRFGERAGAPPMITIKRFTVEARFIGFFRYPRRIRHLRLEGLQIQIPPRVERKKNSSDGDTDLSKAPFILEEVIADGTTLKVLPNSPEKEPLIFDIRQLTLHSVGVGRPMIFRSMLNNAKPPGLIHTDGQFGPWHGDEPGDTPVSGKYTFRDADLSVFKGIAGTLASDGTYTGTLDTLEVRGWTEMPNFSLRIAEHPIHLRTEFQATVDGTNGNTILHPVRAILGDSAFEVSGAIARGALEKHKTILLEARAKDAALENFLRLSIKSAKPPMTGLISFLSTVKIPPGEEEVVDRLQLYGTFGVRDVRFTSPDVQQKIASLSHHAQGDPEDKKTGDVVAQFQGKFRLQNGVMRLPNLTFKVPGANITLAGNYALRSGRIDLRGTAKMQANISDMTTGIKHWLLKPIDPLFARDGAGTVLPINISGTRGDPSFRLDIGRVLKRN